MWRNIRHDCGMKIISANFWAMHPLFVLNVLVSNTSMNQNFIYISFVYQYIQRLQCFTGKRAGLWYPSSRVQTRQKPSDFQGENIFNTPPFGEVKPSVPCRNLRHVKDPKMAWKSPFRLNYRTIFWPIVPPFATKISRVVRTWRYLAAKVGMSKGGGK